MLRKSLIALIVLSLLVCCGSCNKIDGNLAAGSTISDGGYDYSESNGGGDEGGGVSSFSTGGYSGGLSPNTSLPTPATPAMLVNKEPAGNEKIVVDILENIKLKPDGTLDTTNKNYESDRKLSENLSKIQQKLKDDKSLTRFSFMMVKQINNPYSETLKIKLDPEYKNKTAYLFFINKDGEMESIWSGRDYISQKLDDQNLADGILSLNFGNVQEGTFILSFGDR